MCAIVELLCKTKCDVLCQASDSRTPLGVATQNPTLKKRLVQFLLASGAGVELFKAAILGANVTEKKLRRGIAHVGAEAMNQGSSPGDSAVDGMYFQLGANGNGNGRDEDGGNDDNDNDDDEEGNRYVKPPEFGRPFDAGIFGRLWHAMMLGDGMAEPIFEVVYNAAERFKRATDTHGYLDLRGR